MSETTKQSAKVMIESSFTEIVERLRDNDREAVDLLTIHYGRAMGRAIERALFERTLIGGLSHPTESVASEILQTVLLMFLVRLERNRVGGAWAFGSTGHLVDYLRSVTEKEIGQPPSRTSRAMGMISGGSLTEGGGEIGPGLPIAASVAISYEPSSSQTIIARKLLEQDQVALKDVERRFRPEERVIWELIRQELNWSEIARRLGGSVGALRKTFSRAVRRIAEEMRSKDHLHG
jgi:DNA-directed RNA polymerase specialized sigma24 family protein